MRDTFFAKFIVYVTLILFGMFLPLSVSAEGVTTESEVIIFVREGCQYCAQVEAFLEDKGVIDQVIIKDINEDPENAAQYNQVADEAGIPVNERGIPLLYVDGEVISSADIIITRLGEIFQVPIEGYLPEETQSDGSEASPAVIISIFGVGVVAIVGVLLLTKEKKK